MAENRGQPHLFTLRRVCFGLLLVAAAGLGYYGTSQYVNSPAGLAGGYGRNWWDIAYYDLQLFVLGSRVLDGAPPFNPALEVARYLAAATTVFAVGLAASALFGSSWRRWRQRRLRGHAIVVGDTPEARAIAARRAATMRVVATGDGDVERLRAAGIAGAAVVYACGADRTDVAANIATALAAASLRRGSDLRVEVHITDPTLALGLKARRLMMDDDDEPVVDFFSMDEMAARRHVESDPLDGVVVPRILVAGAGVFGQAVVVEFARQWRRRSPLPGQRLTVTLVDEHAKTAAEQLLDRWPVVGETCVIETVEGPLDALLRGPVDPPYRSYFCYEDEHRALSSALSAATLWRGGPGSVVVRLSLLARHGVAFDGAQVLLDDLGGRLRVVNVADVAGDLVVEHRDPVRNLAETVHARYLEAQQAAGVALGSRDGDACLGGTDRGPPPVQPRPGPRLHGEAACHRVHPGARVAGAAGVRAARRRGGDAGRARARPVDGRADPAGLAVRAAAGQQAQAAPRSGAVGAARPGREGEGPRSGPQPPHHLPGRPGRGGSADRPAQLRSSPLVRCPFTAPGDCKVPLHAQCSAALAASFSVRMPSVASVPAPLSRWARTNHWNCSSSRVCSMSMSCETRSRSSRRFIASR